MLIFADDTKCAKEISSQSDYLLFQHDIDAISNWSKSSQLLLHETKTCLIHFCSKHKSFSFPDYKLNSNLIQVKSFYKDLGVTFSSDLSWSSHIETIIAKANRTLYLIKQTFSISSPIPTKKQLYLSLVLPLLTYCSPVWRPNQLKDITALERVQSRATKYILNDPALDYKARLSRATSSPHHVSPRDC